MRANIILLLFFVLIRADEIRDTSFKNYCTRVGGQLTRQVIAAGNKNPHGDKCTVKLALPTRDDDEAREHCTRWGVHVLSSWRMDGNRAECVFENVYHCRSDHIQIRGMCYKELSYTWRTYAEAQRICKESGSELLKMSDVHLGELFEDQFDELTMYFVQPDLELEEWVTFAGGEGPSYVILFNYANFHGVGANSIMKFKEEKLAHVMCMYRPKETILSFSVKAKMLGSLYWPTLVSGETAVWRTTGLYTPTTLPDYDVCQKSLAAILGTDEGTLMNLDPQYTAVLTPEIRHSFIYAYGPFAVCYASGYRNPYRVYFKSRETTAGMSCHEYSYIRAQDYKANWKEDKAYGNKWSFLYYPQTTGGYDFESKPFAIHAPMLCGITFHKDEHHKEDCLDGWSLYERKNHNFVCHRYFRGRLKFPESLALCERRGAEISGWEDSAEFNFVLKLRNREGCSAPDCDSYVRCRDKSTGCTTQWSIAYGTTIGYPDLRWRDLSEISEYFQSVTCEMPAF